jgi:hypothetical protein
MPEFGAFTGGNPPRWANREGAMDVLIVFLCIKGNFTKQSLVIVFRVGMRGGEKGGKGVAFS